jgi:hypothetical protein
MPRSLGGSDESINLVKLSARKHFICHYLLTKMLKPNSREWHKMVRAFMMMAASSGNQQRYFNSRLYDSKRVLFSQVQSENQSSEGNSQFGTRWVHLGTETFKIKGEDLSMYLANGYTPGKYKEPKTPKESVVTRRRNTEREALLPFLTRFLAGESLRTLATEYGKSHVSLHLRLKFHFNDQLGSVKHGTVNR